MENEQKGLVGKIYGITVLPETMDEWIDEIYKRKVPVNEAKDVAQYLDNKAFNAGLEAALGALPEKQYSVATHNKARYESDFDIGYNAYADQAKAAIEGLKK